MLLTSARTVTGMIECRLGDVVFQSRDLDHLCVDVGDFMDEHRIVVARPRTRLTPRIVATAVSLVGIIAIAVIAVLHAGVC